VTTTALLAPWAMLWLVLFRALLVQAGLLPPRCSRCGLSLERRFLGEPICSCRR